MICGSSSIRVRRRKRPTDVTRSDQVEAAANLWTGYFLPHARALFDRGQPLFDQTLLEHEAAKAGKSLAKKLGGKVYKEPSDIPTPWRESG